MKFSHFGLTNSSLGTVIFNPKEMLSIYFRFESADILCEQFNKFVNILKKEKENTNVKYPWLDKDDERRNMSDKEILEKYIDLEKSCLSEIE